MRTNLPITQQEYVLAAGDMLVSTTDLKGRITYCNPAFIEVSGYEKEELLGQPHNMIRHPDMPEEAFRDMWATIASGHPWSAMVKNRRKNGDYYWVQANVTPLMDGEQPVGYMSVRTEPSRDQVRGAESLYRTMRDEKQRGELIHALASGHLVRRNLQGRIERLMQPSLDTRLRVSGCVLAALGMTIGVTMADGWSRVSGTGWAVGTALAVGAGVLCAWQMGRLTLKPLADLLKFANRMAAGDMTQTLSSTRPDAVGNLERALNQLSVNVRTIVRDARTEAMNMRDVTREIAAGNQELSARTESQASSLEETASSMEEITGTVRQSAAVAQRATQLAQDASNVAQRSSDAVTDVTRTMEAISQSSKRIGDIIQVIEGIAFQTNILALNAAVEAARAGEQGRGFAVVASEVRSLSQRTTTAAREVKQLIEDSAGKVETGSKLSHHAQSTMTEVLDAVTQVSTLIGEIHTGANEQLTGISQVNEAVAQLDTITQQNAAMVEELASSATSLQSQADGVAQSVQVFRLSRGDSAGAPGASAVALRKAHKPAARRLVAQPA